MSFLDVPQLEEYKPQRLVIDLSNHNIIENKRTKVNNMLKRLKEMTSIPRFKDKYGNNVK